MSEETTQSTETAAPAASNAGKGLGITAMIVGIVAIICSFIPCFSFWAILLGILAIIFGAISMNQDKKGNGKKGMAKAGLILGIIATIFAIAWYILIIMPAAAALSSPEMLEALEQLENVQ